jgi:xylulokinase
LILTVDLGTTVVKLGLWSSSGLVAMARRTVATARPQPGWAEQRPEDWWVALAGAADEVRRGAPDAFERVEVIGLTGARQTIVPVDDRGRPLGPAMLWNDRRAGPEADALAGANGGADEITRRTGIPHHAGSVSAKVAWLEANEPTRLHAARWLLAPRDLLAHRLTGEVATDPSMASCTGLYDLDGKPVTTLAGAAAAQLAPLVRSAEVVGRIQLGHASELGLAAGLPVVLGAGDRQCEVLGAGAGGDRPMVSWGTAANVSRPVETAPEDRPFGVALTRAAGPGWLLEAGVAAAGDWLAWLERITGRSATELAADAAARPPGARGVATVPWLDGARAPWWADDARAGIVGIGGDHDTGDLARAVIEGVAWEIRRGLEVVATDRNVRGLALAGGGDARPWPEILGAVTRLTTVRRRHPDAASVGAALLAATAAGVDLGVDDLNPVVVEADPDPELVAAYAGLAARADSVASALVQIPKT